MRAAQTEAAEWRAALCVVRDQAGPGTYCILIILPMCTPWTAAALLSQDYL
jgi:hypothetical protein